MELKYPHNTVKSVNRQQIIENCLLEYMEQLPYDHISVASLCRKMGISRRLYYTYFTDKDACLFSLIDRFIRESMDYLVGIPMTAASTEKITMDYLAYWKQHAEFLDVVIRQNLKALVIERSFVYFKNLKIWEYLDTPEIKADDSILWLFVAIRFVILLQWHESDYALSIEDMAAKYLRMLKQPLVQP